MLITRVEAALQFAARAHGSQRYGEHPFTFHLTTVMAATAELGFTSNPHQICAALHDILEDTEVTFAELVQHFGAAIAIGVRELTRKEDEPLEQFYDGIGTLAFAVKLADRLSNLRMHGREPNNRERQKTHLFPKYEREQAYLRRHSLAKDPRFQHASATVEDELAAARARLFGEPAQSLRATAQIRRELLTVG